MTAQDLLPAINALIGCVIVLAGMLVGAWIARR